MSPLQEKCQKSEELRKVSKVIMRYQTAKYQAKNSPSKIEGAGGSMMISSNSPSSFAVPLVFMLPPKSVCQKWRSCENSSPKLGEGGPQGRVKMVFSSTNIVTFTQKFKN